VIVGDFNEWSLTRGLEPLDANFDVHSPGRTFHAARPIAALDKIATCSAIRVEKAGVVQGGEARIASDHLPIWADVTLNGHESTENEAAPRFGS